MYFSLLFPLYQKKRSLAVSKSVWALFHYEKALVLMVQQQPKPDLPGAIKALSQSCRLAKADKNDNSYAKSRLEWIHAKTFFHLSMTAPTYRYLAREQQRARKQLGYKGEPRTAGDKRWVVNYLLLRAQLQIKAKLKDDARRSLTETRILRNDLTVATGWTQFQAVHLNTIEGALLALEGDYENALSLLSRALIPMKATRGKRPEGYLDVARCATWVLPKFGRQQARNLRAAIRNMRDGRSGFWPL